MSGDERDDSQPNDDGENNPEESVNEDDNPQRDDDEEDDNEEDDDEEDDDEEDDDEEDDDENDQSEDDEEDDSEEGDDANVGNPRDPTPPRAARRYRLRGQAEADASPLLRLETPRYRRRNANLTPEQRKIELFRTTHLDSVQSGKIWIYSKPYDVSNPERFKNTNWEELIEPVENSRQGRCKRCEKVLSPSFVVSHVWGKHLRGKLHCPVCNRGNFKYLSRVIKHQKRDNCWPE
ncbi:uncharacterized protein LOC130674553 [Microplitis mediator]|uniref:uncharacterized protein LOC130674553 n=1 Tax=Microplitis mediator TaxID=375433 RepID=UPI002555D844|nr:uncharacterized protein LOC130674553 [Microplitis mediator]